MWKNFLRGVDPSVIQNANISNTQGEPKGSAFEPFTKLLEEYTFIKNLLCSDGELLNNGTVDTTAGAVLTFWQYLGVLREREGHRVVAALRREVYQNELEKRRKSKEREASDKEQERQTAGPKRAWVAFAAPETGKATFMDSCFASVYGKKSISWDATDINIVIEMLLKFF